MDDKQPVGPPPPDLNAEQRARAAACDRARKAVGATSPFGVAAAADAIDIVSVAQFILDGVDPWEDRSVEITLDETAERPPVGALFAAWLDEQHAVAHRRHAEARQRVGTLPPAGAMNAEADRKAAAQVMTAIDEVRRLLLADPPTAVVPPVTPVSRETLVDAAPEPTP